MRGLLLRWLRHTAVVRLAEAGVSTLGIAAVTGHAPKTVETILERYHVRTKKAARRAFTARLDAEAAEAEKNK
jgi:hypothetical protein